MIIFSLFNLLRYFAGISSTSGKGSTKISAKNKRLSPSQKKSLKVRNVWVRLMLMKPIIFAVDLVNLLSISATLKRREKITATAGATIVLRLTTELIFSEARVH